jgi:hypothetical protein
MVILNLLWMFVWFDCLSRVYFDLVLKRKTFRLISANAISKLQIEKTSWIEWSLSICQLLDAKNFVAGGFQTLALLDHAITVLTYKQFYLHRFQTLGPTDQSPFDLASSVKSTNYLFSIWLTSPIIWSIVFMLIFLLKDKLWNHFSWKI